MGDRDGQKSALTGAPDEVAQSGGSFTGAVQTMFDAIAPRYDRFNHWASMGLDYGWRRATVKTLGLSADDIVLDVATGTGDLAFASAKQARCTIGCDFAGEMIRHARRKTTASDRARFHVARAEDLPYADAEFQGVTSAFAMRNVKPMITEVLAEACRVLVPGGRVAILEFSLPRSAPVRWGHGVYTRVLMPRVGRAFTGTSEPFDYLYRSIQEWYSPQEFADMLRAAGFADVNYRLMGLGTVALHTGRKV